MFGTSTVPVIFVERLHSLNLKIIILIQCLCMGEINSEKVLNMTNCVEIYQLKPFCIHRFFFVFGPQSNYRVAYIILK